MPNWEKRLGVLAEFLESGPIYVWVGAARAGENEIGRPELLVGSRPAARPPPSLERRARQFARRGQGSNPTRETYRGRPHRSVLLWRYHFSHSGNKLVFVWAMMPPHEGEEAPALSPKQKRLFRLFRDELAREEARRLWDPFPADIREKLSHLRGNLYSVVGPDGKFTYVNRTWSDKLGYPAEQIIGRPFLDFVHPDYQAATEQVLSGFRSGTLRDFQNGYQTADGKLLLLRWSTWADPKTGIYYSVTEDITRFEKQRLALKENEEKLRKLFELSPLGIALNRMDGRFVEVNAAMSRITGYSLRELNQLSYWDLTPEKYADQEAIQLKGLADKGRYGPYEKEYIRKNGQPVDVLLNGLKLVTSRGEEFIWSIVEDISQRKKMESELRESEEKYRSVVTTLSEGLVLHDPTGKIMFANRAAERVLGLTRAQMEGRDSLDSCWKSIHEDGTDYPGETHPAAITLKTGEAVEGAIMGVHKPDGSLSWIRINSRPVHSDGNHLLGVVATFLDITTQKENEREIEKLVFLAQNTDNAVTVTDPDTKIEWINAAYEKISGYSLNELIGQPAGKLVQGPGTNRKEKERIRKALRRKENVEAELLNYRKDGTPYWISLNILPILNKNNQVRNFISIQSDITGRKAREESLRKLSRDLINRNQELLHFNQVVSHNLRAPAANIIGLTELFFQIAGSDPAPAAENGQLTEIAEHLRESAGKLDEVLRDVSEILEYGQGLTERKSPVDLKEVIQGVTTLLTVQIKETGGRVNTGGLKVTIVNSVRGVLSGVFLNLISNSLKYRAPGRAPRIDISSRETNGGKIEIRCRDNGLGIDLERHGKDIFGMYKRFHPIVEGKGLGLYLSRLQLEKLGGEISVESQPGQGTVFKIVLPG